MIKLYIIFVTFSMMYIQSLGAEIAEQRKASNNDDTAHVILDNFSHIAINFLTMAGNPHHKPTLIQSGCNIITSLTNIAHQALKLVKDQKFDSEDEMHQALFTALSSVLSNEHMQKTFHRALMQVE